MEHSSHSHPLPHGRGAPTLPTPPPSDPTSPDFSQSSIAPATIQTPFESPNPQTRRLFRRNANFNAPLIASRRITPLFGLGASPIECLQTPPNAKANPQDGDVHSWSKENRRPSPLHILQEIQNSVKRKRPSHKSALTTIFQDDPSPMDENDFSTADTSWYNDKSNDCSPANAIHTSPTIIGLREVTLNPRASPIPSRRSPAPRLATRADGVKADPGDDGAAQSRYIEHLESQLAAANARVDALTSPRAIQLRAAKLRTLTNENRNLRTENLGWAQKAEDMVQRERLFRSACENDLRSRMEDLRDDLEMKEARIAELEWEVETMGTQVKNAEGLLEANANLEKRIDVLSNLLVRSPGKIVTHSVATSPKKFESPRKQLPRPRSMVQRLPSSPTALPRTLTSVSEIGFWDSRSRSTSSMVDTPENSTPCDDEEKEDTFSSSRYREDTRSPDFRGDHQEPSSLDHRSQDSASFCSAPSTSSRPTSFISSSSQGAQVWGAPASAAGLNRTGSKSRRMRRFPSGSNALKPLILPTATGGPSLPASAPLFQSIDSVSHQGLAFSPVDPSPTSFLTRLVDSQPNDSPTLASRYRAERMEQTQMLKPLERRREVDWHEPEKRSPIRHRDQSHPSEPSIKSDDKVATNHGRTSKTQNLRDELAHASEHSQEEREVLEAHSRSPRVSRSGNAARHHDESTPRRTRDCKAIDERKPRYKSEASQVAVTPQHAEGLFSSLTKLFSQTKQEPATLARRIVTNAWKLGSSSFGGVAWWLVGPLHHHRHFHTQAESNADPTLEGKQDPQKWPHFGSVSGQKSSNRKQIRNYGSITTNGAVSTPTRTEPHLFPCDQCVEPAGRRAIKMWLQFCLTVVLAVGMAVKHGPASLIAEPPPENTSEPASPQLDLYEDDSPRLDPENYSEQTPTIEPFPDIPDGCDEPLQSIDRNATIRPSSPSKHSRIAHYGPRASSSSDGSRKFRGGMDSGYSSLTMTDSAGSRNPEAG